MEVLIKKNNSSFMCLRLKHKTKHLGPPRLHEPGPVLNSRSPKFLPKLQKKE